MHLISPAIGSDGWVKSSYSGAEHSECVEAALLAGSTAVRDSKRPAGSTIWFKDAAWRAFLDRLHNDWV
ncbi:DUF397 domain-containing protein [Streptomyces sp. NBC_01233]|uniref:DUF397 domain-containing protein n=1 Tax=Streptomyces sp. NBC_01233 TaxID=2903787 RepID=UPI002E116F11|nr:DUF397 domain-containing protein [Streptomyces sp. NBC_01233]